MTAQLEYFVKSVCFIRVVEQSSEYVTVFWKINHGALLTLKVFNDQIISFILQIYLLMIVSYYKSLVCSAQNSNPLNHNYFHIGDFQNSVTYKSTDV